jgi:hypothetical protein
MSKFLFGLVLFVSLFVSACSTPLPLDVAPDGGELVSTPVAPTPTVTPAVVPVVVPVAPVVPVVPAVPAEGSVEVEPVTPSEGTGVVVE